MKSPFKYAENRKGELEWHVLSEPTKKLIRKVFVLYRNGYRDREIAESIERSRPSVRRFMKLGGGLTTYDRVCHVQNRENRKWLK